MKNAFTLFIGIIGISIFLNAQISENYTLRINDLIFQTNRTYDIVEAAEYSNTDKPCDPQNLVNKYL